MKFIPIKKWQWCVLGGGYVFTIGMYFLKSYLTPGSASAVFQYMFPITHVVKVRFLTAFTEPMFALFWFSMLVVSIIRWIRYRRSEI